MPRRNRPQRRQIAPDAVYADPQVAKFINRLMQRGKKSVAERIFYDALERLDGKANEAPLEIFRKALGKAKPLVRVKARRVGGSTYQVPMEVREEEGVAIGSRWLIEYAKKRNGKSMAERLSAELLETYLGSTSATMKKRDEVHRMAEANKAFAHYRF
ncbi:MAG: 30S ribosomal protein S7 [Vampirovibrionales bacterium]|nr:30S ribosomal protein S7 [Vampirovibrionales bacterium]